MNKRIKEQLVNVTETVMLLEMNLSRELKGKGVVPDSNSPLRALEDIREAVTHLRLAKIRLGI